jgi:hypothetical protein
MIFIIIAYTEAKHTAYRGGLIFAVAGILHAKHKCRELQYFIL